jgi:hypothetical protein
MGSQGVSGVQGRTGQTGTQGYTMAGLVGSPGASGAAGAQGVVGSTGAQGPVGIVDRWNSFRVINFDYGRADLSDSDRDMIFEAATYMAKNPSLQIGLDGYNDPNNQTLSARRVFVVRQALIAAGVPSEKVQTGAFGNPQFRQDRRVEMLLSTR